MTIAFYQTSKRFHFIDLFYIIRRDEIIDILKHRYVEKFSQNIPIFGIEAKDLRDFTTTEKDMRRGTSRFPPN